MREESLRQQGRGGGNRYRRQRREDGHDQDRLGKMVFFTSLVITFANFITSWEIWGSELGSPPILV
jgi:hypothetical protein